MPKTTSSNNCGNFVEAFIGPSTSSGAWGMTNDSSVRGMTNQTQGSDTLCKALGNILGKLGKAGNCDPDLIPNCFLSGLGGLTGEEIAVDLLKDVTLTLPSFDDLVAFEDGNLNELDASIDLKIPGTCYLDGCSVTLSFKINETTKTGGDVSEHIGTSSPSTPPTPVTPEPEPPTPVTITATTSASITGCTDFSNQIPGPSDSSMDIGSTILNNFICKNSGNTTTSTVSPCLKKYGDFGTAPESTAILSDLDGIKLTLKLVNGIPYIYLNTCVG